VELFEWDAETYASLPLPHVRWGAGVIDQLGLTGGETVLDLGAGTGRDAGRLLELLPSGRVIAVDGSLQMLETLRAAIGSDDRLRVVPADLRLPLELDDKVDAAISVATLHWIPDHDVLFRSVFAALRPGGLFVAEGGGAGNVATFRRAVVAAGGTDEGRFWTFANAEQTRARLESAGFVDVEVRLIADPARLEPGAQLEAFIATVMLGPHLRDLPADQRRPFVHNVAELLPEPVVDYVRLQLRATRPEITPVS
jgi:trans-aconitate 2-methyltransferase